MSLAQRGGIPHKTTKPFTSITSHILCHCFMTLSIICIICVPSCYNVFRRVFFSVQLNQEQFPLGGNKVKLLGLPSFTFKLWYLNLCGRTIFKHMFLKCTLFSLRGNISTSGDYSFECKDQRRPQCSFISRPVVFKGAVGIDYQHSIVIYRLMN